MSLHTSYSIADYRGVPKDVVENFHGNQLVYIGWDQHLIFCSPICVPLPPDAPFGVLLQEVLPGAYGQHPDFAKIDWSQVEWSLDQQPFQPSPEQSLAAQGIGHKSVLRFRTPGLNGLQGSAA